MAFIPTPGVGVAAIEQTLHGQQVVNTMAFFVGGASTNSADLAFLAETLFVGWQDAMLPNLSGDLFLNSVRLYSQDSDSAPIGVFTPTGIVRGGKGDPAEPGNVALCVKFSTGGRGRSSRGRNFIAGLGNSDVFGNQIDGVVSNLIVQGYGAIRTAMNTINAPHVVLSKYSGGLPRSAGQTRPVTLYSVTDNFVDSQRRRLTKRGQ